MESSPEGSRTASEQVFIGHAPCRESAPLRPPSACRSRPNGRWKVLQWPSRGWHSCPSDACRGPLVTHGEPECSESRMAHEDQRHAGREARFAEVVDISIDGAWLIGDQRTHVDYRLRQLIYCTVSLGSRDRFVHP